MSTKKGVIVVINDSEKERESHDVNGNSMNGTKERQSDFEEEFNGWLEELDREIESTRRSEQLTEKDYSIRINAKD